MSSGIPCHGRSDRVFDLLVGEHVAGGLVGRETEITPMSSPTCRLSKSTWYLNWPSGSFSMVGLWRRNDRPRGAESAPPMYSGAREQTFFLRPSQLAGQQVEQMKKAVLPLVRGDVAGGDLQPARLLSRAASALVNLSLALGPS